MSLQVALKLVPDNKTLITILTAKDEDNETLKEEMETLVSLLVPLLQEIHSILVCYHLPLFIIEKIRRIR